MGSSLAISCAVDESIHLNVLVIDDDLHHAHVVREILANARLRVLVATKPLEGLELFRKNRPDVVLLDMVMPDINGLELLEQMVELDPAANIILMTGHYSPESAVQAIQKGACDYMTKPLDIQKLRARVNSILDEAETRRRTLDLERELLDVYELQGIIGRSPLMLDVFALVRRVARHYRTVLVTGATGTGKELVAKALHQLSPVSGQRFATCNCSALMESIIESELFGYVRGAFTGAVQDKRGIFEYAHGGTIFLDEIGELSMSSQAKLLRVLQYQEIQRVGSPVVHQVDVRIVAATNRDLRDRVKAGKFREDLYYRLAMIEITLPGLADRKEDLPLLQRHFIRRFATRYKKDVTGITRRAQTLLSRYSWPGNVRELENVLGHACMMTQGPVIDVHDLPDSLRTQAATRPSESDTMLPMEEIQKRHLVRVLEHVNGNKAHAAEILGLSRATVYDMLSRIKTGQQKRHAR